MTFATFNMPNGLKRLVTPEYVVAVQSLPGDTSARVWTVADSAPGASRGYSIVLGSFLAVTTAIGGLVTLPLPDGSQVAIAPRWVTQLEQLPGNTSTRVVWAADGEGGYATVVGSLIVVGAALSYTPPTAAQDYVLPFNQGHNNASPVSAGAFYLPAPRTWTSGLVELYSTGNTNGSVTFWEIATVTLSAQANDPGPSSGYRSRAVTFTVPTWPAGWYVAQIAEAGGGGGTVDLLGAFLA